MNALQAKWRRAGFQICDELAGDEVLCFHKVPEVFLSQGFISLRFATCAHVSKANSNSDWANPWSGSWRCVNRDLNNLTPRPLRHTAPTLSASNWVASMANKGGREAAKWQSVVLQQKAKAPNTWNQSLLKKTGHKIARYQVSPAVLAGKVFQVLNHAKQYLYFYVVQQR